MQDDYAVNVARIISNELQKVVDGERIRGAKRLGTLGFPALITTLCQKNGIHVEPKMKIHSSIDKKFIDHHCTNPEENPRQRNRVLSPPASPSSPTLDVVEKRVMRRLFHLEDQQSAMCRGLMHLYYGLQNKKNPEPFMNPEEFSSFMNWPRDRPSSIGGRKQKCRSTQHGRE